MYIIALYLILDVVHVFEVTKVVNNFSIFRAGIDKNLNNFLITFGM